MAASSTQRKDFGKVILDGAPGVYELEIHLR